MKKKSPYAWIKEGVPVALSDGSRTGGLVSCVAKRNGEVIGLMVNWSGGFLPSPSQLHHKPNEVIPQAINSSGSATIVRPGKPSVTI